MKKKNYKIEILRFVFCLYVLFYHMEKYIFGSTPTHTNKLCFFSHGAIGVEFFFLVSGFLMAQTVYKNRDIKVNVFKDTYQFIKKKLQGIFLPHVIAFFPILFVTIFFIYHYNLYESIRYTLGSIPSFFLLQDIYKLPWESPNHVEWYLSVMLISMTILYPIFRNNYKRFVYGIAPCIVLAIIIYFFFNRYALTGVSMWTIFCYKGMLRGFLDISIGCILFEVTRILNTWNINKTGIAFLSILEIVSFVLVTLFVVFSVTSLLEYAALFFISINVGLAFSNKTWKLSFLDNRLTYFLGKLSLPIYLSQLTGIYTTTYFLGLTNSYMGYVISFVLTILLSLVTLFLTDYIRNRKKA